MSQTSVRTNASSQGRGFIGRALACALACALALSCAPIAAAGTAWADVRKADVVLGSTVDSRGLSVAQCPSIDAQHAIVVDDTGTVYFERDADASAQIASITKVMTAIVALENADLDTEIHVSEKAASVGESTGGLMEGDVLTLRAALDALLVSSGNDAAIAIAETLGATMEGGGGSDDAAFNAFVTAMNAKASELGMTQTVFENPHGLDFDQYEGNLHSSARDVATMCSYAMQNDTFREVVSQSSATLNVERDGEPTTIELQSTDELIGVYDGACGIKTGFTELAGECFAGACYRDGHYYYAIVLDSSSEEQRFTDATTLFDWVFDHQVDYPLANSDETVQMTSADGSSREVPVVARVAHTGWIDKTVAATLADPDATVEVNDLNGNVSQEVQFDNVSGDVHVGDKVGTITFYQRNEVVATQDLVAAEEVLGPNLFEGIGIWFERLFGGFSGDDGVADSVVLNTTPLLDDKTAVLQN